MISWFRTGLAATHRHPLVGPRQALLSVFRPTSNGFRSRTSSHLSGVLVPRNPHIAREYSTGPIRAIKDRRAAASDHRLPHAKSSFAVPAKLAHCGSRRPQGQRRPVPHRSSIELVIPVFLVAIAAILYAARTPVAQPEAPGFPYDGDAMATQALPGRPGNLTAEQDEQLRKLWARVFELCGIVDPAGATATPTADSAAPEPLAAADRKLSETDGDKTKKKRLGLFSRKSKKDSEKPTESGKTPDKSEASSIASSNKTSIASNVKEGDPEDKYGQNKIFLETLATQSPESLRATIWRMIKHDNPDALLLRFLRARKWDVERALIMFISSISWRATEARIEEDVMGWGEGGAAEDADKAEGDAQKLGQDFLKQMQLGKSLIHGVDKAGRPICLVRVRLHKAADQCEESVEKYTMFLIETTRLLIKPPVDTATIVFDMTGFSMANMDYAPVKFMIKCFEANFPECLGAVLVHKAPWIFQGIWRIIKGWLDPVVASKVHFTNDAKAMEEFVALDKLPKELDGEEDWQYQYTPPIPGENDKMKDTATRDRLLAERELIYRQYEDATLRMIRNPTDQAIRKERNEIAARMRTQYWQLDPYIRARSWYDRTGVLKPDGSIDYYPAKAANGTGATASPLAEVTNSVSSSVVETPNEKVAVEHTAPAAVPVSGAA
ncbi:phosphatidylinositol transfer protein CSR1 [Magnaporthiopsis poae ATCC 64411]|uniref:Phosphatidylinositol transfer protein CSR1 n=1 Tax=Magnaporthiopsis poae (strain ATCC 64411 / 73-15) TaxID=644358 RepID=A0A0C4DWN5_MAGP6|nr:phosphatidylinositol transfer protein CSR1 [Magnaporthiopsis poae ATCC 64411]